MFYENGLHLEKISRFICVYQLTQVWMLPGKKILAQNFDKIILRYNKLIIFGQKTDYASKKLTLPFRLYFYIC